MKSQDFINPLNTSESTIRRDLQESENGGFLERVYGNTKEEQLLNFERNMSEELFKNVHERQRVAKLIAETINDEDVIYLDTGPTILEMISFL